VAPRPAITTISEGPNVLAIALRLRTKPTGAIGALTSHASVHASVSASPQFFCSSDGTVVLTHGFPPPGLASNHRGGGIHTHSIFTRRPQGEPAAFSICRLPYRDRLRAAFFWADKTIRLAAKIPGTILDRADWTPQRLAVSSARNTRRGTSPLRRGFCHAAPGAPTPGPFLFGIDGGRGHRLAALAAAGKIGCLGGPLLHQVISQTPIFRAARNSFDCAR
jgi:hypothetical protein